MGLRLRWEPALESEERSALEAELDRRGVDFVLYQDERRSTVILNRRDDDPEGVWVELPGVRPPDERAEATVTIHAKSVPGAEEGSPTTEPSPAPDELPGYADPLSMALVQAPAIWALWALPADWWGHVLRVIAAFWLLGTVPLCFRHSHGPLEGYGVGLVLNAVWGTLLWRSLVSPNVPDWLAWIAGGLLGVALLAQWGMIRRAQATATASAGVPPGSE